MFAKNYHYVLRVYVLCCVAECSNTASFVHRTRVVVVVVVIKYDMAHLNQCCIHRHTDTHMPRTNHTFWRRWRRLMSGKHRTALYRANMTHTHATKSIRRTCKQPHNERLMKTKKRIKNDSRCANESKQTPHKRRIRQFDCPLLRWLLRYCSNRFSLISSFVLLVKPSERRREHLYKSQPPKDTKGCYT